MRRFTSSQLPQAKRIPHGTNTRGFSLVELLLVVAIVGLLSTFAITGFNTVVRSTKVSSAAQAVADALNLARSSALSRNRPVEIRFLELPEFDKSGSPSVFRGVQIFTADATNSQPITKPYLFPNPIVASKTVTKSSILSGSKLSGGTNRVQGNTYNYVAVTFGSDGMIRNSSGLSSTNQYFITLQTLADLNRDGEWPDNYATVSINPVTGNTKVFQPR